MYESSKHANWLLVTLLLTLLISGLVLSWLLTRSSLFASPEPLTHAPFTQQVSGADTSLLLPQSPTLQPPEAPPTQNLAVAQQTATPLTQAHAEQSASSSEPVASKNLAPSLLDSQQQLEQATIIPQAILPLASLAANTPNPLPRTTAPAALTLQGLQQATDTNDNPTPSIEKTQQGWIYAGQFQNGAWSLVGLNINPTALPEANQSYQLVWGANVRSAPPGQKMSTGSTNLAENVDYLAEGSTIQVLTVKPSGKNGHIWLEIQYGE